MGQNLQKFNFFTNYQAYILTLYSEKRKRVWGRLIKHTDEYGIHTWRYYTLIPLLNPNTTMDVEYFRPSVYEDVSCTVGEKERPNALTTFGCGS